MSDPWEDTADALVRDAFYRHEGLNTSIISEVEGHGVFMEYCDSWRGVFGAYSGPDTGGGGEEHYRPGNPTGQPAGTWTNNTAGCTFEPDGGTSIIGCVLLLAAGILTLVFIVGFMIWWG